jgi:hypothetical protein
MDEIFRISGSFAKGLEWCKNGPRYKGSIVITPKKEVFGVADMYHGSYEQTRFLYGKIVPVKEDGDYLMLLMLSAKEPEKALFITIPNVNYSNEGGWGPVSYDAEKDFLNGDCQSLVSFDREYVDYLSTERRRIKYSYYYHFARSIGEHNRILIKALNALGGSTIEYR